MPEIHLQIRPGDCDSFGHVNNAVYVGHVQQALAETMAGQGLFDDWGPESEIYWQLKSMVIEYRQAARLGDRLTASIWLEQLDEHSPIFGCEIKRLQENDEKQTEQTIVRSRSKWCRIEYQSGEPVPLPEGLLDSFRRGNGSTPRRFKLPADSQQVRNYVWTHKVMRSELSPTGHVHPQEMYKWIEESIFDASSQGGWPVERCQEADFLVYQMRHDSQFFSIPGAGDEVRITSRIVDVRRLRGTWLNEISDALNGDLLVRNYSTGVFLNLAGRPATPPPGMMDEIRYGDGS